MRNLNKSEWALASIVVAGIVLICFVGFALYGVFHFPLGFGSVSVLLLVGIAAFIGIMNLLSVSSHLIGITNAAQPFGLPEGTVRAILTIAFIVLVGVLASFLLTNSSGREPFGDPIVMRGIAAKDADSIVQRLLPDSLASIERSTGDKVDIQVRPKRDYRLADDVAKQILTMLSTILAAMIGFYFGAQTPGALPQSGRTNESDKRTPTLTSIDPSTLMADGTPQTLVITGTNLNKVQTVSIENESTRSRNATSFKVDSAEQVTAVFTLNSNTPAGDWVVVVSDGDTTARLPGNLKIGA
jgi:hypothetical protein